MRTFTASLQLARSFGTSTVCRKQQDIISGLFLKQICDLVSKQKAAGGSLVNTSPKLKKQLEEQLNRLAQKFKLANAEAVNKLQVEFQKTDFESSVAAVIENKSLDDLINEINLSQNAYEKERAAKKEEEIQRQKASSS